VPASTSVAATVVTGALFSRTDTLAVSPPPLEVIVGGLFGQGTVRSSKTSRSTLERIGAIGAGDLNTVPGERCQRIGRAWTGEDGSVDANSAVYIVIATASVKRIRTSVPLNRIR